MQSKLMYFLAVILIGTIVFSNVHCNDPENKLRIEEKHSTIGLNKKTTKTLDDPYSFNQQNIDQLVIRIVQIYNNNEFLRLSKIFKHDGRSKEQRIEHLLNLKKEWGTISKLRIDNVEHIQSDSINTFVYSGTYFAGECFLELEYLMEGRILIPFNMKIKKSILKLVQTTSSLK